MIRKETGFFLVKQEKLQWLMKEAEKTKKCRISFAELVSFIKNA